MSYLYFYSSTKQQSFGKNGRKRTDTRIISVIGVVRGSSSSRCCPPESERREARGERREARGERREARGERREASVSVVNGSKGFEQLPKRDNTGDGVVH